MSTYIVEDADSEVDVNSPEFNKSGKNEVKSISSANQALQIAQKLEWNDRDRDIRRARVLSAFNGTAPYTDAELIQKAQSYRYNVSFGFLEGMIGRAVVPYNDLSINIDELTEIEANLNDEKLKIIQVEFGKIMKKWGKWAKFASRLNQDLVLNGYNTAIFPSDYDPFPTFVEQSKGFVDERSPNDENDLELFVWKKSYLIHELYTKISDADVAKKAGWDVENVRKALMGAAPQDVWAGSSTSGVWTEIEKAIRAGSLWSSVVGAKMVETFHVFASELDGSVTHWIVLNNTYSDSKGKDDNQGIELFKKEDRFESMRDFLVYFDMETGDGTWHGSRGLGQRGFNTHKAIDKLRCSLLDQAFSSGLTILQPGDQIQQEEFTLSVQGPFAIIPPGITINPVPIPSISNTTFTVDSLLSATSEQRIGDIVPQTQSLQGLPKTATEARISAGRQELITRGNLKRYIDPLSRLMSIIVRRLLKKNSPNAYAKEFQAELKRKGLTDDDLKEIRGARNTGRIEDILGNTAANTQLIFAEFRGDPDVDQYRLKNMRIASVLDADVADELLINEKDQTRQIESQRLQELEITSMTSGLRIPVSPRDNHEVHIQTILQWIAGTMQRIQQQPNPSVLPIIRGVLDHGMQHLNYLEQDKTKKNVSGQLKGNLNQASDVLKELEKQAIEVGKQAASAARQFAQTPEQIQQAEQMHAQLEQKEKSL